MAPGGLDGQDPDTLAVDSVGAEEATTQADSAPAIRLSPGAAMIRSLILPGWGQAEFDSHFRGGVYFAGWAGNWYMIFRNAYRLDEARTRFDLRFDQLESALIAASPNPDSMRAQIDSFPNIMNTAVREDSLGNELRKLVNAREQQQEDWIAWSLFWVLASGIDAFVTAHLHDFPADVDLRPTGGRSVSLTVSVPVWPPSARPPRAARAALPPRPPPGPPPGEGMPDSR
jgi:hypothetical protein